MTQRRRSMPLWVVLLALLSGCAQPPRTTVNAVGDKFSKDITLEGVPLHDPTNGDDLFWMLRSYVNPQAHTAVHEIYVAWSYAGSYSGKYFAADDTARPLRVTMILKETCRGCDRTDTLGIAIDEATLRARAATGFEVKLSAQDGTAGILSITPQMINAQLQAEDSILAGSAAVGTPTSAATPSNAPPAPAAKNAPAAAPPRAISSNPGIGLQMMPQPTSEITHGNMHGAVILGVVPDSPAALAGIRGGDLIVKINGHAVDSGPEVQDLIAKIKPNSVVKVDILRGTSNVTLQLKL